MRKYYISDIMRYCYPFGTSKIVENYGALSQYIGKFYSRAEIDRIVCELVTRHPYIEGSMMLSVTVMSCDEYKEIYHAFDFKNFDYEKQERGDTAIKFEK